MSDSKKKDSTSVRLTDNDRETFQQAMELEGMDAMSTWIIRAARLHAKEVIREHTASVDVEAELKKLREEIENLKLQQRIPNE